VQSSWFVFSSGGRRAHGENCSSALNNPEHNGYGPVVSSGHVPGDSYRGSDFRAKGNQRDPSGLSRLCPSLPEGVGGVGREKSPAKQVY